MIRVALTSFLLFGLAADAATPSRSVFLQIEGTPLAAQNLRAEAQPAAQQALARRLTVVEEAVRELGVPVVYRFTRVLYGLQVRIRAEDTARIRRIQGIRHIRPVLVVSPSLVRSVPHIGAAIAHTELGLDGSQVRVGVADSGVDYIHAAFGGVGLSEAYEANDPTKVGEGWGGFPLFPTAVVVGGTDFVGADYHPTSGALPNPDPDPIPDATETLVDGVPELDWAHHGTHVAGIIASQGSLKVGRGVAPGVSLYALKIASQGSTDMVPAAIEWASDPNQDGDLSDRLDVLNISYGSAFGGQDGDIQHAEDLAITAFVSLGGVVVSSAGNNGDVPLIHSAPAAFPTVISVANSRGPTSQTRVEVISPEPLATSMVAVPAAPSLALPLSETGAITGSLHVAGLGCSLGDFPPEVGGAIALIDRGECTFSEKLAHAAESGAIAAILIQSKPGPPTQMTGEGEIAIPAVMVAQESGLSLREALEAGEALSVRIGNDYLNTTWTDRIRSSSSRGPACPERSSDTPVGLKPDLSAPGSDIASADAGSGVEARVSTGTSMSAPHVAGVVALLRQAHPGWSPLQLKAALMNTTVPVLQGAAPAPLSRQGAGRVDVLQALATDVVAYAGESVSLDFGYQSLSAATELNGSVTIENLGTSEVSFSVQTEGLFTTDRDHLTLAPGAQETIPVLAQLVPNALPPWRLANHGADDLALSNPERLSEVEHESALLLHPTTENAPSLRVPIYLLARPTPELTVVPNCLPPQPTALTIESQSGLAGWSEIFGLVTEDADEEAAWDPIDIRAVGVRLVNNLLQFAVTTYAPRVHPSRIQAAVYIDTTNDAIYDYVIFNADEGALFGDRPNGKQRSILASRVPGDSSSPQPLYTALGAVYLVASLHLVSDLQSPHLILSAQAETLGLSEPGASIRFWLATWDHADPLNGGVGVDDTAPNGISSGNLSVSHESYTFSPGCSPWQFEDMTLRVEGSAHTSLLSAPSCADDALLVLHDTNAEIIRTERPESPLFCLSPLALPAGTTEIDPSGLVEASSCLGTLQFSPAGPIPVLPGTQTIDTTIEDDWGAVYACSSEVTVAELQPEPEEPPAPPAVQSPAQESSCQHTSNHPPSSPGALFLWALLLFGLCLVRRRLRPRQATCTLQ